MEMYHAQEYDGPGLSLREELDDYLGGVSMRSLPNLREWTGALKLIRLAERETEDGCFHHLCFFKLQKNQWQCMEA